MSSGDGSPAMPLNASGVDFANQTQAYNFLQELLNDTLFQPAGTSAARKFWYGVVVVVGVAALHNITWKATQRARLASKTPCIVLFHLLLSDAYEVGSIDNIS